METSVRETIEPGTLSLKEGQPDIELYFWDDVNSSAPQPAQAYTPDSLL